MKTLLLLLCALTLNVAAQAPKPVQLPAGIRMEKDIAYIEGGDEAQKLDLYLPDKPADKPLPLIVHIHGGGYVDGESDDYDATKLAKDGKLVDHVQFSKGSADYFAVRVNEPSVYILTAATVEDVISAAGSVRPPAPPAPPKEAPKK